MYMYGVCVSYPTLSGACVPHQDEEEEEGGADKAQDCCKRSVSARGPQSTTDLLCEAEGDKARHAKRAAQAGSGNVRARFNQMLGVLGLGPRVRKMQPSSRKPARPQTRILLFRLHQPFMNTSVLSALWAIQKSRCLAGS